MRAFVLAMTLLPALGWAVPVQVPLRNAGFETGALDGWDRAVPAELFSVSDAGAHSGGFCLRVSGDPEHEYTAFTHLAQAVDLTPIPGGSYEISAWVRSEIAMVEGRSARVAVRQVSADDTTLDYANAGVPSGTGEWRQISHRFRASGGAVRFDVYVIASNLGPEDALFVDDIDLIALDGTGNPVTVQPPPFSGGGALAAQTREIACPGLTARISAQTGLLASLELIEPEPMLLQPPAEDATVIYAQVGGREVRFTRVLAREGNSVVLGPDGPGLPLTARVSYSGGAEGLSELVSFEATGDLDAIARLGVRHGFRPEQWERILCAMRPVRAIEAGESTVFSYGERPNDLAPTKLDTWQSVSFPMTVLEGADRWVLVGSPDLDGFVTVTPNQPLGYFPSVQMNPTQIAAGDSFDFRLAWRAFPKTEALLRDVWRAYAESLVSDDPLIRDLLPFEAPEVPRTLPPGLEMSAGGFWAGEGARIDLSRVPERANLWYFGWHDWINERYPTEGEWWCRGGGWGRESAEGFRDAIASYQASGRNCYLYFRDIANLTQRGNPLPEDWFLADPGGGLDLYGGGYTIDLPPEVAADAGFSRIEWGTWDFDNDPLREDYLQQVRECMDFYRPGGIAWDMGWRPNNPGVLAVQAESFRWLREHHPQMRVISNEASGTPSQWFADCILIENGILYGKSVLDYEVAKAFGSQIASIERGHQFEGMAATLLAGDDAWPFPQSFADARRFARWSMETDPLPPDAAAAQKELGFRLNMRGGLRCLGLGAQWAYVPDAAYGPRPVPAKLMALMADLMAIPPIQESFAVRIDGGADADRGVCAAAWADAERLVVAAFNDTDEPRTIDVAVDAGVLARRGWSAEGKRWTGMAADSLAALRAVERQADAEPGEVALTMTLEPFTLQIYEARTGP